MSVVCFCFTAGNSAFSSDNVLQAIQVDGAKDSYNIILKSDDVAEVKKTIQAPNKMILNLKGIRASKTINTIYNNTSNVDSVVVEPTGEDSVKILVQAENAGNAEVHFDTLKTPLGVLDKSEAQAKKGDELVLNAPMQSYKPVYDNSANDEEAGFSLAGTSHSASKYLKRILHNEKISWMVALGLFAIVLLGGIKAIKGNDNDIKVGLTQSLKEREIELYKNGSMNAGVTSELSSASLNQAYGGVTPQSNSGANYGLRAYQNGARSPYLSAEMQRPRPVSAPVVSPQPSVVKRPVSQNLQGAAQSSPAQNMMQNTIQGVALKTPPASVKPRTTNVDSIKFLESMTKIYEKNGRSDLAQGLKTNMKKAKANLA